MQIRMLAVVGVLMLTLFAHAADSSAPPHPTMLFAEFQGKPQPVIAVEKEEPVILVDGRRKRLRGNVALSTERLPHYSGLKAELSSVKIEILQLVAAASDQEAESVKGNAGATMGGYVELTATINAAQDLSDCFVVLFGCEDDFLQGDTDRPNAQIRVRQIADLKAGEPARIKFATSPFLPKGKLSVFVLLFSGENEVAINTSPVAASYFHSRERVIHTAVVKKWLAENRQGSRAAQPLLQIPPLLGSINGLPKEAIATLTVRADGSVLAVTLDHAFPNAAEKILNDTLSAWLFLPQIENGSPVSTRVKLPLKF
jgi:hypothetical protein